MPDDHQCPDPNVNNLLKQATSTGYGWTLWREIYGTFIGVLPFLIAIVVAWTNLSERVRVSEVQLAAMQQTYDREVMLIRQQTERDRQDLRDVLTRISQQIESLQKEVAGNARR